MSAPSVAVIMLLPQCNMHCSFCITEDVMGAFTFEQACALLERLKDEGFQSVVLGGGEPLAWKAGAFRLAERARSLGLLVQLGTNGILLRDGFERCEWIDRYVLPLDGSTATIHNAVRFYRSRHFDFVIQRLDRLREAAKSTTVSTVVTRVNVGDLLNIAELLIARNDGARFLHAWHLYQFIPEGRGGAVHAENLQLSTMSYNDACERVRKLEPPFRIYRRPDMLHSRTVEFFWLDRHGLNRQLGSRKRIDRI